jgi:hypothetical protein
MTGLFKFTVRMNSGQFHCCTLSQTFDFFIFYFSRTLPLDFFRAISVSSQR